MAPYTLNVSIMGTFEYVGPDRADSTDLIVVNGLSILYSSLRETVMMLTARMMHGVLCLPGANFMDHAPSRNAADSHQETPKKKRGKTLARKKTGS